jgi:diguanylate cyclase (GGDEF)-like protein
LDAGISMQHEHKSVKDNKFFILTLSPVRTKEGQITAVTIISKEITRIKSMEEKLYALSITDELTGLYNRRGFLTLAQHQLKMDKRNKNRTFLLYADLDNLKEINDTLGHADGDIALISFSDILKATYRESDTIGRIGGDEFVIYPVGTTEDNAATIAARLQNNIDIHNAKKERKFRLSVSLGIVLCDPDSSCSIGGLLAQADKLMYEIKKKKRESHFPSVIIS